MICDALTELVGDGGDVQVEEGLVEDMEAGPSGDDPPESSIRSCGEGRGYEAGIGGYGGVPGSKAWWGRKRGRA